MRHLKRLNQSGMAMILEVGLLAIVLLAVGFVGYRVYQARHGKTVGGTLTPSTVANGKPDNAFNALQKAAKDEVSQTETADSESKIVNDDASSAKGVEGGFDENNF